MTFEDFLLEGAQPGYERALSGIAERWETMLGKSTVNDLIGDAFPQRATDVLEHAVIEDSVRLTLATDMKMIAWWRGLQLDRDDRRRFDTAARQALSRITDGFSIPGRALPKSKLRRAHVVFAGTLLSKMHSPSGGAIDYAAALALDPQIQRLEIIHHGPILPDMAEYIEERLGPKIRRSIIRIVSADKNPLFLKDIIESGPCTFHNWCESQFSVYTSVVSRIGPMVTFTCGDEAPIQHADVFWYFQPREYMEEKWREQGAPEQFIGNYVQSIAGPCLDGPPPEKVERASLGLASDAYVMATVGNRLAIEMDETFLNGMIAQVKAAPQCVWLVVGALPEGLVAELSSQLGAQFLHVTFEPHLARLMTTVDLFANPFRSGGGNSANLALGAGAAVLTSMKGDVSTLVPREFHAQSPEDYFRVMHELIQSPDLLSDWKTRQFAHNRMMRDQRGFLASLQQMIDLAGKRYNDRFQVSAAA